MATAVSDYTKGTLPQRTAPTPTPAPAQPARGSQAWTNEAVAAALQQNPSLIPGYAPPAKDVGAIQPISTGGGGGDTPSPGNMQPAPLPDASTGNSNITPSTNPGSTALSFAQVENFWIQAGGSPQAAAMAAAVADAESGLNAAAQRTNPDGTSSVGLWGIPANGMPPGSTDPLANARAAVQLSQMGTDWSQWCSTWSDNNCGQDNGTYLGQGANALMSLGTQKAGASYNVFGASPAGSGVGASSATSGLTGGSSSSTSSKLPILIGVLVIAVVVFFIVNRKKAGKDTVQPAAPTETPVV